MQFLVDSGAAVSCIPAQPAHFHSKCKEPLVASNGTHISTYGIQCMTLDLGLDRKFSFNFVIADVNSPILGADFLGQNKLLIDFGNLMLSDSRCLQLSTNCVPLSPTYHNQTSDGQPHGQSNFHQLRGFKLNTQRDMVPLQSGNSLVGNIASEVKNNSTLVSRNSFCPSVWLQFTKWLYLFLFSNDFSCVCLSVWTR